MRTGKSIYVYLNRLEEVIEDVTGVRPSHEVLLDALTRRASQVKAKRFLALALPELRQIWTSHTNRQLASRVARWSLRAMGPDTPLLYSYPFYCEMAKARGIQPWSYRNYRRYAWGFESRAKGFSVDY